MVIECGFVPARLGVPENEQRLQGGPSVWRRVILLLNSAGHDTSYKIVRCSVEKITAGRRPTTKQKRCNRRSAVGSSATAYGKDSISS
jgi:hypothetical protein